MTELRLVGRSSSHFTRVTRLFAHELNVPLELEVMRDMKSTSADSFAGNPAAKIPILCAGQSRLWGAENICRRLVELAGPTAPRVVWPEQLTADVARNAQELIWYAMSAQVQWVMGTVIGNSPADGLLFVKAREGLSRSLAWLDAHVDEVRALLPPPPRLSLFEVTLFCLVEHLAFRPTVPLDGLAKLAAFRSELAARPSAQATAFRFD